MKKQFKNKTVLVTGHTGFQGGWLSLWLNTLGAKVVGYSLEPPSEPNLFKAVELSKDLYHNIRGDVRNFEKLYKVFVGQSFFGVNPTILIMWVRKKMSIYPIWQKKS